MLIKHVPKDLEIGLMILAVLILIWVAYIMLVTWLSTRTLSRGADNAEEFLAKRLPV